MDGNGKDDGASVISITTRPPASRPALLPLKVLLLALLATGFLAVLVIFLSGVMNSMLPRFSVLYSAPSSSRQPLGDNGKAALERWTTTRPPASTNAWHNMTDDELRWAASWHPRISQYPYKRVPKVAFLFLTQGPLPLAPLWEKFFAGAGDDKNLYSIYIHSSPDYNASSEFPATSPFYHRHVPSKVVEWGQPTMVDAERRLLANALLDVANDRFVLLSESCVPLYNFSFVYTYLTRSNHSFVGAFDEQGPGGRGRYSGELAPEVTPEQWRKGAQWFELHRDLAVLVVADDKYYPKFQQHCRPGCYVDEHYLPTVLSIEAPERIANRSVTWTDWSGGGAHPNTFREANVDEAFLTRQTTEKDQGKCTYNGQSSEVCFLFSRKFAPDTLKPMLNLAPKMLGYG